MLPLTRFLRFVIVATLLLLIPAFVYLSQSTSSPVRDPKTGEYIWEALMQSMQGHGPDQDQVSHGKPYFPITDWRSIASHWMPTNPAAMYHNWHQPVPQTAPTPAATLPTTHATISPTLAVPVPTDSIKLDSKVDGAYAPSMSNETAKAELGRSTWRFLHTMMARFPDKPTPQQSADLQNFMRLFSLLYPCGDCAAHFQQLLKEWPPQTASRHNAEIWLCNVHNQVNRRLHKPQFDCSKLNETYDCGCGTKTMAKTNLYDIDTKEASGMAHILPIRTV